MIVDQTHRLDEGEDGGRADEFPAALFEVFRDGDRFWEVVIVCGGGRVSSSGSKLQKYTASEPSDLIISCVRFALFIVASILPR